MTGVRFSVAWDQQGRSYGWIDILAPLEAFRSQTCMEKENACLLHNLHYTRIANGIFHLPDPARWPLSNPIRYNATPTTPYIYLHWFRDVYSANHATAKLNKLPTVSPATSISPMNPPAASLSSTSTHSPAPIMHVDPRYPLLIPNKSCTIIR